MIFNWGEKPQTSFPNWLKEWWLFLRAIPNIFCSDVRISFDYFKANSESFFSSGNSYSLSFCSQFGISRILCWDFNTHLEKEFKIKWWAAFKISRTQTLNQSKIGLILNNPNPKNLQKILFSPRPCLDLFLGLKLPPKLIFLQTLHKKPI